MKTKFFKKITESKGNHAVRELRYTTSTIDLTAKVSKVLLHAADTDTKLKIIRFRKNIIQAAVDILVKKNKSLKSTSAALKSKNKTNSVKPSATTANKKNLSATTITKKKIEIDNNKKSEKK
jgi:hypothetical protein